MNEIIYYVGVFVVMLIGLTFVIGIISLIYRLIDYIACRRNNMIYEIKIGQYYKAKYENNASDRSGKKSHRIKENEIVVVTSFGPRNAKVKKDSKHLSLPIDQLKVMYEEYNN